MKLSRVIVILLFATVVIMGCGDDDSPTTPANPTMDGTWQGTIRGGVALYSLENLSQSGNNVTGTVIVISNTGVVFGPGSVSGTNTYPDVSLSLSIPGYQAMTFTGSFSDDNTVAGVLNGSGFVNEPLTLVRGSSTD
jgi:hypothetical protein